jgi:hypothetical protein
MPGDPFAAVGVIAFTFPAGLVFSPANPDVPVFVNISYELSSIAKLYGWAS